MMRTRCTSMTLLILATAANLAGAQEASNPKPNHKEALQFRRVFVPTEELPNLTRGYMPMDHDLFQKQLKEIESRARAAAVPRACVTAARYHATQDGHDLIDGNAILRIASPAGTPAAVTLHPLGLAIGSASWLTDNSLTSAVVGMNPADQAVVLTEQPGDLHIPWSLRGRVEDTGDTVFELSIPPTPRKQLILDLPPNAVPEIDHGLIVMGPNKRLLFDSYALPPVAPKNRRWLIELGAADTFRLRIADGNAEQKRPPTMQMRQDTNYQVQADGLTVVCNINIDIGQHPLNQLVLETDSLLAVTGVQIDDVGTSWYITPTPLGRARQLLVVFPKPLANVTATLQVTAIATLQVNKIWRLPTVHVPGVSWRQGSMAITTTPEIELCSLVSRHAQGVSVPEGVKLDGSAPFLFRLFDPDGALEVFLRRQTPRITAEAGTSVHAGQSVLTAVTKVDLRCERGQLFQIDANVPGVWTIDGIDAEPADALRGYRFADRDGGTKHLQIQLAHPLTPTHAMRLIVRSHRAHGFRLRPDAYRPVRITTAFQTRSIVAISADPAYRLSLTDDGELTRLDPTGLSADDADRLDTNGDSALTFVDDEKADLMTIRMTREVPVFAASIRMDVDVAKSVYRESYRIKCQPESVPMDRFLIDFSESREHKILWVSANGSNRSWRVERLDESEQQKAGLTAGGETWQVILPHATDQAVEVAGWRESPLTDTTTLSLAALPAATSQEGWLSIGSPAGLALSIDAQSARRLPLPVAPAGEYSPVCARYRYDPSRSPHIEITHKAPGNGSARAWAWDGRLTSWFAQDGTAVHRAVFKIENRGATQFAVTLPTACTLRGVELDGQVVPGLPSAKANGHAIHVSLPARRRFVAATVFFAQQVRPGRHWMSLTGDLPKLSIPVLDQHWTVWLPRGFLAAAPDHQTWTESAPVTDWRRRLFGPLAAGPADEPFQPFSPESWRHLLDRDSRRATETQYVKRCLDLLGRSLLDLQAQPADESLTWRSLCQAYHQRAKVIRPEAPFQLLIDAIVLAEDGFSIDQQLPTVTAEAPAEAATELLARGNLAIVANETRMLLTSAAGVCRYRNSIGLTERRDIFFAKPGSQLAQQLSRPDQPATAGRFPVGMWATNPALPGSPWRHLPELADRRLFSQPCQICEMSLSGNGHGELVIYQPAILSGIGWAALLIAAGLQIAFGSRRARGIVPLLIGLGAVALAVPAAMVPITSRIVLGTLLGVALQAMRHLTQKLISVPDSQTVPASVPVTGSAIVLVMLIVLSAVAQRASGKTLAEDASAQPEHSVYQVFTPIGKDLQPVGHYDYLPLGLYDAIHRASNGVGASPALGWLLRGVTYRATFNWRQQRSALDLTRLTAVYRLQVTQERQPIRIPWPVTRGVMEPVEAQLAGQPVELEWNPGGTAFTIHASSTGVVQLELMLRPTIRQDEQRQSFRFAVPQVVQSRLEISAPLDATDVEVSAAIGTSNVDVESGVVEYSLGPVSELGVSWPADQQSPAARSLELEQLMWLQVQTSMSEAPVVLATQLTCRGYGDSKQPITLATDKSLRLLPLDKDMLEQFGQPVVQEEPQRRLFTFSPKQPVAGTLTLRPRFSVVGLTGIGRLRLPYIDCTNAKVVRRWFAVSTSSELEIAPVVGDGVEALDTAAFMNAWGTTEQSPRWVCRLNTPDPSLTFAIRARPPQTRAQQELTVHVGHASIDWVYHGDFDTKPGKAFQCRFNVPQSTRITSVDVKTDQVAVAAHVTQGPEGVATVFLTRGVTGEYQIELRGSITQRRSTAQVLLPVIMAQNAAITSNHVHVFRSPSVLVTLENAAPSISQDVGNNGRYFEAAGRQVASLDLPTEAGDDATPIALAVRPNRPTTKASLVTTLRRQKDQWEAETTIQVSASGATPGVLDAIRLEVPVEWQGPFTIDPPIPHQVQPLLDQQRAHLVLWPNQPISGRFTVHVRAPLKFGNNERVRSPDIVPLDVADAQRYYVLPTRLDQQRIQWKTSGLQPVALEDVSAGASDPLEPGSWAAYRVWSRFRNWSQPRAVIADVRRVSGKKQISLADVHIACQRDGRCYGLAAFRVEPAGAKNATLFVPDGFQLAWVDVERAPVSLVALANRRWQIPLEATQLPQQITIIFTGKLQQPTNGLVRGVTAPWITDFAIRRTLWSVRGPTGLTVEDPNNRLHQVSVAQQYTARLKDAVNILETAADIAVDSPPDEVANWYTPWAVRMATDTAWVRSYQSADASGARDANLILATIMTQQQNISDRLKMGVILQNALRTTRTHPQSSDIWEQIRRPGRHGTCLAAEGACQDVRLAESTALYGYDSVHGIAIVLVGLVVALSLFLWQTWWVWFQPSRQWWTWGIGLGMVWWIACRPSWLGLLVVCIAFGEFVRRMRGVQRAKQHAA